MIRLKTFYFSVLFMCFLSTVGIAQEIGGVIKLKSSTIFFDNFGFNDFNFTGEIHSNLSGSKYTVQLKSNNDTFEGLITDKFSKLHIDLTYKNTVVKGVIDMSTNGTKDTWDVLIDEKRLSGVVKHNALGTADTYELQFENRKLSGEIFKNLNSLVYDLMFGESDISGVMKYNISTVKHTYDLKAENLSKEDFVVVLFVEIIKLINEHITEVEEFQEES